MEGPKSFELKPVQEPTQSRVIESVLKTLRINDQNIDKYKNNPEVIGRIKRAEIIVRQMEDEQPQNYGFGATGGGENIIGVHNEILDEREAYQILKKKLEGDVLIDLGCDCYVSRGPMIADILGASLYVGVEKYINNKYFDESSNKFKEDLKEDVSIDVDLIVQDMLVYVSALPDNSANFMISGIDNIIIPDKRYWIALEEQIRRALKPGGVVILGGVRAFDDYAKEDLGYRRLKDKKIGIEILEIEK